MFVNSDKYVVFFHVNNKSIKLLNSRKYEIKLIIKIRTNDIGGLVMVMSTHKHEANNY